ncbi:ribose import ATP-binding protein RbsA [Clostridia bacterium]|nr:ribose import ATP-binding protein RbsA [Clostridia bacterium]
MAENPSTVNSILRLEHITKIFPGVKALDDVSFDLRPGEIHALMGENGAGKSTFIKVITGVHKPEGGKMFLYDEEVHFDSTRDSQQAGIACIYQHSTAYPDLTIAENIFLGHEIFDGPLKKLNWRSMHARAKELLDSLGSELDTKTTMGELSVAQQQIVEIAKALSTDAKIIIMDEPTAALTKQESEDLYRYTRRLQASGVSIIFISHRFEDMYELGDRVTVLRDAQYIGTWDVDKITNQEMILAMVGREITNLFPKREVAIGDIVLEVKNLKKTGLFRDISFHVRKGEIVSLTGLIGAGRSEVAEAIFGIAPADSGEILIDGAAVKIQNPTDAGATGIGLLPEDRQRQALILDWEISKNIGLGNLAKFKRKFFYNVSHEEEEAQTLAEKLAIKASTIFDKISSLSGGNQQKVVIAKILTTDLKLIILDEPTKGVDVGAKAAIYEIMGELSEQGYGILLISSEMPEVLGMSDRILVMKSGRVTAEFTKENATQEAILAAAILNTEIAS